MKNKQKKSMALTIVQNFFPMANRVNDGDQRITLEVTQVDSDTSVALDHAHCALAICAKRSLHADGVIIGTKTAYIIKGRLATRYQLLESTAREIVSFDRKAGFAPGLYQLVPPSIGRRLGETRTGATRNASGRKVRMYHRTTGIRTMLNRKGVALLTAGLLLLSAIGAQATPVLTDLTPGGAAGPLDPKLALLIQAPLLLDQAYLGQWNNGNVSALHGQDYVQTDIIGNPNALNAVFKWDFGTSGFAVTYIEVGGIDAQGVGWNHLYHVNHFAQIRSGDFAPVTINGTVPINDVVFFGYGPPFGVPDGGSTILLLLLGLLGLAGLWQGMIALATWQQERAARR